MSYRTMLLKGSMAAAGAALAVGVAAPMASAAPLAASPDTARVSCSASTVWVSLTGTTTTCYTGNGSLPVHLPGIGLEKIKGRHTVCLTSATRVSCVTNPSGTRTVRFSPAITVTRISISS